MRRWIVGAVAAALLLTGCGAPKSAAVLAEESASVSEPAEVSTVEETSMVTFSDEQIHKGNLILVNSKYAYDFDANGDADLVRIVDAQKYPYKVSKEEFRLCSEIMPALDNMIRDCDEAMGTQYTSVSSAWRSKEYQENVWDEYAELYGESYSQKYVAVPGHSEHHTGLAADLGIIYGDGSEGTFSESENAKWMAANSYRYGFVRRYAEDKIDITGISNEAWHFRYVGQPHAAYMHEHNLCLEEYLEMLKADTSPSNPLCVEYGGKEYSVYYTADKEIPEPSGDYTVSGDNMGGYIITEG